MYRGIKRLWTGCWACLLVVSGGGQDGFPVVYGGMPAALAVVDDVADRVLLFDPQTGAALGELLADDPEADHLGVPLHCVPGPALTVEGETYPHTVLISDHSRQHVLAYDADTGQFLRTFIDNVTARGLAWMPDGRLAVAAGRSGVKLYQSDGTFVQTLIPPEPVDGPNNAWSVLVRPGAREGDGDMLVADPTLDAVFRFDLEGNRLGVFAKLPAFTFVEQLAARDNGNVLVADTFGSAVHELDADGNWLRSLAVTRPRGVIELLNGNLLIACEEGIQVFDGVTGQLVETPQEGYPATAPRYVGDLRCRMPYIRGDMNGDGVVNSFDIDAFILALGDPDGFSEAYPLVEPQCAGDVNRDAAFNAFDIDPFIALLTR